jgi:ubiquinol-cytochrome c reductase cytochrome b subunit
MKHLRKTSIYCLILLLVLIGLALIFPPGLLKAPVPGVEETKPPWVFWYFYPIESLLGIPGILFGSAVLMIGLVMIPILGFLVKEEKRLVRVVNTIVIAGLIVWLALLVITYFSPTMKHL